MSFLRFLSCKSFRSCVTLPRTLSSPRIIPDSLSVSVSSSLSPLFNYRCGTSAAHYSTSNKYKSKNDDDNSDSVVDMKIASMMRKLAPTVPRRSLRALWGGRKVWIVMTLNIKIMGSDGVALL